MRKSLYSSMLIFITLVFSNVTLLAQNDRSLSFEFENRYFIERTLEVPLFWDDKAGSEKIEIVYRIFDPDQTDKPYLFFVGGGPGHSTLDSYWPVVGSMKQLQSYAKYFRVVLFDQRGVGRSFPLKKDPETLDPALVRKAFYTRSHARDLRSIIKKLGPAQDGFYIAGHSYGSEVVFSYLGLNEYIKPSGVLLLNAVPQGVTMQDFFNSRIETQIALNQELFQEELEFQEKILRAREVLEQSGRLFPESGLSRNSLDGMVLYLEDDRQFRKAVETISVTDPSELDVIQQALVTIDFSDIINYVLDWGFHRWVPQQELVEGLPSQIKNQIEPWMIIETRALMSNSQIQRVKPSLRDFFRRTNEANRGLDGQKDLKKAKSRLEEIYALAFYGERDPLVPKDFASHEFALFKKGSNHKIEVNPQEGHYFSLFEDAAKQASKFFERVGAPCRGLF